MNKNYIVNNLLCFLSTAKNDFSKDILFEQVYSFYSIDDIKESKEVLANIINKNGVTRKEPDKKRKEVVDLFEFFDEFSNLTNNKNVFVADTYKRMPPVGLHFIAPILTHLSEEIIKINEVLPKIGDIKSEMINTSDTVRTMKADIKDLINKMSNSIIKDQNHSHRQSFREIPDSKSCHALQNKSVNINGMNEEAVPNASTSLSQIKSPKIINLQKKILNDLKSGQVQDKKIQPEHRVSQHKFSFSGHNESTVGRNANTSNDDDTFNDADSEAGWVRVGSKRNQKRRNSVIITGRRKNNATSVKSINRTVDVFVGRVDKNVTSEDLSAYIVDNFEINIINICKLDTITQDYNCYKVTVSINDREKMFNADQWPEGIIIKKFFNKSKRQVT